MSQAPGSIIKVGAKRIREVQPPTEEKWRITTLVAKGTDFGISFSNGTDTTGLILENDYNLSAEIFVGHENHLVFDNDSKKERIGFYSGDIVKGGKERRLVVRYRSLCLSDNSVNSVDSSGS